jgi:hypothetical protein
LSPSRTNHVSSIFSSIPLTETLGAILYVTTSSETLITMVHLGSQTYEFIGDAHHVFNHHPCFQAYRTCAFDRLSDTAVSLTVCNRETLISTVFLFKLDTFSSKFTFYKEFSFFEVIFALTMIAGEIVFAQHSRSDSNIVVDTFRIESMVVYNESGTWSALKNTSLDYLYNRREHVWRLVSFWNDPRH